MGYRLGRGMKETFGVLERFSVWICMVVTWLSMHVKVSLSHTMASALHAPYCMGATLQEILKKKMSLVKVYILSLKKQGGSGLILTLKKSD